MTEELTSAAKTIEMLEPDDIKLDNCIKKLLSEKQFLARIIKGCVDECNNLSYEEIMTLIGDVEFMNIPVEPGLTNTVKTDELSQEDFVAGESLIKFDILTYISVPIKLPDDNTDYVKLYINLEAQKNELPGYDITERGIFYMCREISRQCGKEFTLSENDPIKYGGIKKVYSIWICPESAQKRSGTTETIRLTKEIQKDGVRLDDSTINDRYDIMVLKILRLSKNHSYAGVEDKLFRFLTDLVNDEMSKDEKLDALKSYGIKITKTVESEVNGMTAYARNIAEKGMAKGLEQGRDNERRLMKIAFSRLKEGCTPEELIAEGMDAETVNTAFAFLRQ